jgi:hypothetical protein
LSVRQILLQDERVHWVDDHIPATMHDECRLGDRTKVLERPLLRRAPFGDRLHLCGRNVSVHLRIAIFVPPSEAFQKRATRRLARLRRCEESTEQKVIRLVIGGSQDFLRLWCERREVLAAAWTGVDQHEVPDEVGSLKRDFLRDKAAE